MTTEHLPPSDSDPGADVDAARSGRGPRRGLVVGLAAGLLGGAAVGFVAGVPGVSSAATDDTTAATDVVVAQVEGDDPTVDGDRAAAATDRLRTALDDLVADGTITAEQADAVAAHLVEQAPDRLRDHRHGPGHHGPGRFFDGGEEIAELLGLEVDELRDALREGSTLAELAEANGVSTETLVDALVEQATERLDAAVENGRIDADAAAERAAELRQRIEDRIAGDEG